MRTLCQSFAVAERSASSRRWSIRFCIRSEGMVGDDTCACILGLAALPGRGMRSSRESPGCLPHGHLPAELIKSDGVRGGDSLVGPEAGLKPAPTVSDFGLGVSSTRRGNPLWLSGLKGTHARRTRRSSSRVPTRGTPTSWAIVCGVERRWPSGSLGQSLVDVCLVSAAGFGVGDISSAEVVVSGEVVGCGVWEFLCCDEEVPELGCV